MSIELTADAKLAIWEAQYVSLLSDLAAAKSEMSKSAGRDSWETAYIRGAFAAYQRVYDDLLALYHDFCGFRRLLGEQQTTVSE
ncbi:hypothetical protein [Alicyclobacillus vulcanalis]|uniref:Uncharacterized protein n=1 Tax=Alicyclobacillus vulcanalis TaxID=252246 RepID=A0A1N7MS82_9BACL|nr:hypothetical protein [Alicyclobacillus vulcanalis]SIS88976.1 hypothetical protein SAMN05421799_10671 [Alicyclobacillus vulcanalis]